MEELLLEIWGEINIYTLFLGAVSGFILRGSLEQHSVARKRFYKERARVMLGIRSKLAETPTTLRMGLAWKTPANMVVDSKPERHDHYPLMIEGLRRLSRSAGVPEKVASDINGLVSFIEAKLLTSETMLIFSTRFMEFDSKVQYLIRSLDRTLGITRHRGLAALPQALIALWLWAFSDAYFLIVVVSQQIYKGMFEIAWTPEEL